MQHIKNNSFGLLTHMYVTYSNERMFVQCLPLARCSETCALKKKKSKVFTIKNQNLNSTNIPVEIQRLFIMLDVFITQVQTDDCAAVYQKPEPYA